MGNVSIAGYSRMITYARISNYTNVGGYEASPNHAQVSIYFTQVWDFGEQQRYGIYFQWDSANPIIVEPFKTIPSGNPTYMEITASPTIKVTIIGGSWIHSTPYPSDISCLISIGIYLRNE